MPIKIPYKWRRLKMDKLKMETPDLSQANIEKLAALICSTKIRFSAEEMVRFS